MTATTETRKRSREDDSCDSMPLSKRINNLHINNGIQDFSVAQNSLGHSSNHHHHPSMQHMNGDYAAHLGLCEENGFISQIAEGNSQEGIHVSYNPELNQHENPYYYNKNKLLYELHLERMRRTHQP